MSVGNPLPSVVKRDEFWSVEWPDGWAIGPFETEEQAQEYIETNYITRDDGK